MFADRIEVSQRLAGMGPFGKPVDHAACALRCKINQTLMLAGTRNNHIDILAEDASTILHTFSTAKAHIFTKKQTASTELKNGCFKTDPGPQRRPLKKHRQHASRKDRFAKPCDILFLQVARDRKNRLQLHRFDIEKGEQVSHEIVFRRISKLGNEPA